MVRVVWDLLPPTARSMDSSHSITFSPLYPPHSPSQRLHRPLALRTCRGCQTVPWAPRSTSVIMVVISEGRHCDVIIQLSSLILFLFFGSIDTLDDWT